MRDRPTQHLTYATVKDLWRSFGAGRIVEIYRDHRIEVEWLADNTMKALVLNPGHQLIGELSVTAGTLGDTINFGKALVDRVLEGDA